MRSLSVLEENSRKTCLIGTRRYFEIVKIFQILIKNSYGTSDFYRINLKSITNLTDFKNKVTPNYKKDILKIRDLFLILKAEYGDTIVYSSTILYFVVWNIKYIQEKDEIQLVVHDYFKKVLFE